jgi:hypothetical protein
MIASGEARPTDRSVTAAAPDEPLPAEHRFAKWLVAAHISKNMEGKLCG